jgi:hypothetical protein
MHLHMTSPESSAQASHIAPCYVQEVLANVKALAKKVKKQPKSFRWRNVSGCLSRIGRA